MTSTEKLLAFIEQLVELDDNDLEQLLPIPMRASRVRGLLAGASARVPLDHAQLDEWALQAAMFCLNIRSDGAQPAAELAFEAAVLESGES